MQRLIYFACQGRSSLVSLPRSHDSALCADGAISEIEEVYLKAGLFSDLKSEIVNEGSYFLFH